MGLMEFAKVGALLKRPFAPIDARSRKSAPVTPKGFLRIRKGDVFSNGRYVMRKQLGAGRYSNVWLAQDHHLNRPVAIKVLSSEYYNDGIRLFEREVMRHIRDVAATSHHPGRLHIMEFIEDFEHQGPSGKHVCLVLECLGPDLQTQMEKAQAGRLSCAAAKQVGKQLLQALDFLHNECGVLHTDINTSNILITNRDHVAVQESKVGPAGVLTDDIDIRLSDFGLACWVDEHLTDNIQPLPVRAPEVSLGAPWEASVDTYNIGCILYYFVIGKLPFHGRTATGVVSTTEDDRLGMQTQVFGEVPDVVLSHSTGAHEFFDENGELHSARTVQPTSIENEIQYHVDSSQTLQNDLLAEEIPVFCDFLTDALATDPRKRKAPGRLVQHPWLDVQAG